MKSEGHLPKNVVGEYRQSKMSAVQRREIDFHLLTCGECRGLLPKPQSADFWASVLTENRQIEPKAWYRLSYVRFGFLSALRVQFARPVVVSAFVLVLAVLGFSLLFFGGQVGSPNDRTELALAPGMEEYEGSIINGTTYEPESAGTGESEPGVPFDSLSETQSERKEPASERDAVRRTKAPDNKRFSSSRTLDRFRTAATSDIRGSLENCFNKRSTGGQMKSTERGLELRWEKVPDALKYTVYVSDFDERLIDEYETTDKTSHVIVTELDPKITYRWKLLITLKNGQTITGLSQNFTSKGISENRSTKGGSDIAQRSAVAKIRCAERK